MTTLSIGFTAGPLQIQAARGLFAVQSIGSGLSSTASPPPTPGSIIWQPGLWGLTYQYPWTATSYQSDLSLLATAGSAWKGYMAYATWDLFENATQGTYTWTLMDNTIAACAAQNLKFMIQLNLGTFNSSVIQTHLPNGTGSDKLPEYLVKGSSFGAALMGNSGFTPYSPALYGYYVGATPGGGCYWANFTNANVMARIQALANAMGARYNGNPNFYGVILCAWDVQSPNTGAGITDAQYFGTQATPATQGRELILSYFKTAMPNCNVCEMTGYVGPGGSNTIPQTHAQWCVQNAIPLSCSDTAPATAWNATYEGIAGFTANGASFSSITSGGTVGNLNGTTWSTPSANYLLRFTSTAQTVTATIVRGASTCTFSPAVTGSPNLASTQITLALMPGKLNAGMYTWFGITYGNSTWTPPSAGMRSYCSFFATVEGGDFSNAAGGIWPTSGNAGTAADILNACNLYYDASHVFMTIFYGSGNYTLPAGNGADFANIYASLNAIGVTNTAYPSVYPQELFPNISALPNGSSASAPWTAFLAATGGYSGWATNIPYVDNTGVRMRRLTNRSTLGGGEFVMEYAEGGPKVSQPLGNGQYWIACLYGTSGSHTNYFCKYQIGLGLVVGSLFQSPQPATGLNVSFSMIEGESNICYIADNSNGEIHRYDCNAQAYAANSVFSGTNASINCGVNNPGWMATSWDGTVVTFQAPYAGPTAIFSLNTGTGSLSTYTGSSTSQIIPTGIIVSSATRTSVTVSGSPWATTPGNGQWDGATITMTSGAANGQSATINSNTANTLALAGSGLATAPSASDTFTIYNVNELHVMHGNPSVVWLEDNNSESSIPYAWFPASGNCTAAVGRTVAYYGGHSDSGASNLYTMNPNAGSYKILNEYTPGTAPATDGGAWTGTLTNYWGTTAALEPDDTGGHFNISWAQIGAGVNEWVTRDSFGEPYNDITANSWSVHSGSIYQTTTSGNTRPICGVMLWNGTIGIGSQITGSLTQVASLASVTAGTFYTDGTTLYAWMPTGIAPTASNVILRAGGLQTDRIAYYKQDGSQIRTLCWLYYEPQDAHNVYYHNGGYANVSPDGLVVIFASDLGTYSGFADLIGVEVPT